MTCTELGAAGPQNSCCAKESWLTLLVKLAQEGQENGQTSQADQQI